LDTNILAILLALGIATVSIIYFLNRRLAELKPKEDSSLVEWLKSMEKRLDETSRTLNQGLATSSKTINESLFKQTQEMLAAQRQIYGKLAESAKTIGEMSEIGKSMKDLQQFLASPKLRGGLGEQVLKELLTESLPQHSFNLQYAFRTGAKVDAAIKTSSGIIPIDSKFSLENFRKMMGAETEKDRDGFRKLFCSDVRDRIDEISKKYILTDEGTVDFALMYVPSESVYYEIINCEGPSLMDYAHRRRVMPVSPSTFYAFLRSVLLSFEGQQIAAEIKGVQAALRSIQSETGKFGELLQTLQTHVNNSYAMMNKVANHFVSLSSKVEGVQSLGNGHKLPKEKPTEVEALEL
jgi:DNA recombination protein RmuC